MFISTHFIADSTLVRIFDIKHRSEVPKKSYNLIT